MAQAYPSRPVRMIVGFAAGGGNDIVARLIGQWLSERLGQPFVIENRPGAGTNIATEAVVQCTLRWLYAPPGRRDKRNQRHVLPKAQFQFHPRYRAGFEHHAAAPGHAGESIVSSQDDSRAHRLCEGQSRQGQHVLAGIGTISHLAGELFKMMAGVNLVHVPFGGNGPALTALLGGQVEVSFASLPSSIEYIRTGKLRGLAVTSAMRSEALPDVPAVGEFVPGYEVSAWYGVGAPKGTPVEVIDKLNKEINAGLADPS